MVWAWMLWLSFALGTRALPGFGNGCAIVCSRNTNVTMVWAWSHYFWHAFGTRTFLWFGARWLVCSRNHPCHYLSYALYALRTHTLLRFGHGCAIVCSRNTNVIMVWAWMHYLSYALGTRTLLWFGHGCACHRMLQEHELWAWMHCNRMLAEHERYYGLGLDALVIACSRNTNVIMVWAWMH